ncbi:hypothetical protein MNBD_ALPHA06-669 [hydrothermal vent metagenome]|uniref:DUF4129 domain-containing protein n=1 Tax=hydrothermal vent metagenome TaxID=652676 RepID=A0A3B0R2N9_9ZZZZ
MLPIAAVAQQTGTAQQKHAELMQDKTLQFEFTQPDKPKPPPKGFAALIKFFEFIAPLFKLVFWAGLVVLVVGFFWLVLRELIKTKWAKPVKKPDAEKPQIQMAQPEQKAAKALLEQADQLASNGRFSEAVHLLLFRSIEEIERHLPGHIKRAQTSREIELLTSMPAQPRCGFEQIRLAVERSFFGQKTINAQNYQTCRAAYENFAFSAEWK